MEVTKYTFASNLPSILHDLTSCSFVSIDLELSGIASHQPSTAEEGQQTLQERYTQIKEAAERYQILQIGLTIAHEDVTTGKYTLKPYNFYLNPIIDQKLETERIWSYQSSAVEFLVANGFRMQGPFEDGVPYLSRDEEKEAADRVLQRNTRPRDRPVLDIAASETESLAFLVTVRQAIDAWLAKGKKADDYLNISSNTGMKKKNGPTTSLPPLNRFQKRLVHRLVESEYPSLVTIGRPNFVQIIHYDEVRENAVKKERLRWMEERTIRQTGFRWIVEALAGGDLSKLEPKTFDRLVLDTKSLTKERATSEFAGALKLQLKAKQPVLVGHNLFVDLVNLCKCFFGNLPERVEDFQKMVHQHFPLVIDTKYMGTHECGSINPTSSLTDLHERLKGNNAPEIIIDPEHKKYADKKLLHEAGYDSMLTAEVFIKLSAQLQKKDTGGEADVVAVDAKEHPATDVGTNEGNEPIMLHEPAILLNAVKKINERPHTPPDLPRVQSQSANTQSRFAHRTLFELLTNTAESTDSDETEEIDSNVDSTSLGGGSDIAQQVDDGKLIPRFQSDFWKIYGNKVRVFGTKERVCILA